MTHKSLVLVLLLMGTGCVPDLRFGRSEAAGADGGSTDADVAIAIEFDAGRDVVIEDRSVADRLDVLDLDVAMNDVAGIFDTPSDLGVENDRATIADGSLHEDDASDVVEVDRQCGECSIAHAESVCVQGVCRIDHCLAGFANCNGEISDGCEADLGSPSSCGLCGIRCGTADVCLHNACVSQVSCPGDSERGCGLVAVSGATIQMGSEEASTGMPLPGQVTVSPFVVDTHEVTIARFRRFWMADRSALPSSVRYPNGTNLLVSTASEPLSPVSGAHCNWTASTSTREYHPVNCVNWSTALAFCVWDGGRLPTEAEYEYLSRYRAVVGLPMPRRYPWGDEDPVEMVAIYPRPTPCERAQFQFCVGDDGARTRRVGSFPASGGVFDLAGNLFEWMADRPASYGSSPCWGPTPVDLRDPLCDLATSGRSVRGGSFQSGGASQLLGASRESFGDTPGADDQGFRCVRSP